MGGNAFNFVSRIRKENIKPTLDVIVEQLDFPGFNHEYLNQALLGSVGKKETSGDIDVAMNDYVPRFVGEPEYPVFNKHEFLQAVRRNIPDNQLYMKTFSMGNLITAWPIVGQPGEFVQVDFIFGKLDWLAFSHYSPDNSRFKGVFLQQSLGILAKMKKDCEVLDQNGERVGRVGLHFSLELGLFRSWQAQMVRLQGVRKVDADTFETKFDMPRYTRIGYISDPEAVLRIILDDPNVEFEQINSFEKLVAYVRQTDKFEVFRERFLNNFARHNTMLALMTLEDLENDPVWNG